MTSVLDDLIAQLAIHLAHSRGIPPASAERTVRRLVKPSGANSCPGGMFVSHHSAAAPTKTSSPSPSPHGTVRGVDLGAERVLGSGAELIG